MIYCDCLIFAEYAKYFRQGKSKKYINTNICDKNKWLFEPKKKIAFVTRAMVHV